MQKVSIMSNVQAMTYRYKCYNFFSGQFVAHPNVQQLLASIWYEGLPGFRRKNMLLQSLEVIRIGMLFPLFSILYILAPHSRVGKTLRKPFIKFICHSASYFTFLCKLIDLFLYVSTYWGLCFEFLQDLG